jgi:enoyl-CoA hydratase
MSSEQVRLEQRGNVAIVRMDRPPANAIEMGFASEFSSAFDAALEADPGAIVLTGTGRFFSGGLDLRSVPSYTPAEQQEFLRSINRMIGRLYSCPVPLVGAVNGHAIAGGLVLVLATDYRVGTDRDAQLGLTEARVGIPFPAVAMAIVTAELSAPDLRYVTLHASRFGPAEARSRGVLDELRPPDEVLERAVAVADDHASMPTSGYAAIKRQARAAAIEQIERVIADDSDPMQQGWIAPEASEAALAILRAPRDTT